MNLEKLNYFMDKEVIDCPWASTQSIKDIINEVRSELDELEIEVNKDSNDDLPDELADVFSDVLLLIHIAKRDGYIKNLDDAVKLAYEKKVRRKGWLLEGKTLTREEASRIWYETKEKEKKENGKLTI